MSKLRFLDIDEASVLQHSLKFIGDVDVHAECARAPLLHE